MKKVLLISPHADKEHNETRYVSPAIGVIRIASYLMGNGHYAEAYDPNLYDIDKNTISLEEKLREFDWDIVGVSCLEETLANDLRNIWIIRKILPDVLIIAGGLEAQYNYQTILDKSPCNIIIIGEGERPTLMLCEDTPLQDIPGIIFKNKAKALTKEQFELASFYINWKNIHYERYWNYYLNKYGDSITDEIKDQIFTVRVFSKNRCPFLCKFCTSTNQLIDATGEKIKPYGIGNDLLITIIERIKEYHPQVRTIYLTDDDFCFKSKDVIDFCKSIIDKGLNSLSYMCFARINDLNDEMLSWMKKAGFRRLNVGVESFSDNVLKEVGKNCTSEKNINILKKIKEHGIQTFFTVMLITPESKMEDVRKTVKLSLDFIKDPFYTCGLSLGVRPTKGSEFYEIYNDFETILTEIPEAKKISKKSVYIKENKMIYAKDPIVKYIQNEYYKEEKPFLARFIQDKEVKHATYSNIAEAQLNLMLYIIDKTILK